MDIIRQEMLEEVDLLFRKMTRMVVKERDKVNIEGVMLPGFLILNKIVQDGGQRLSDLAEELDFTSGAITALCDKLEKKGFAVRKRHKEDRRIVLLDITDDGRDFLARNGSIGQDIISTVFEGFSPEEIQLQIGFYRRLINNLGHFSSTIMTLSNENKKDSAVLVPSRE